MIYSGILINIEGIDGSGKSSVTSRLATALNDLGISTVLTREPGATSLGKQIRSILHERTYELDPKAEFLLFASDRAQHMTQVVYPALCSGSVVISDRMADSSCAYQGYGRGLDISMIKLVNSWAMQGIVPSLTLYIKVDYKTAASRLQARNEKLTTFERERQEFFTRVIEGFEAIFSGRNNVVTIDGSQAFEVVAEIALQAVLAHIKSTDRRL